MTAAWETTTMTTATDALSFSVLVSRMSGVEAGLQALAKRAARKGLAPLTWTWGKPSTAKEVVPHPEFGWQVECRALVSRVPLTLSGDGAHFAGWTFVAALQHMDGENVVRTVLGQTVPELYRTRGPVCDHCRATRRRNETFVLRHDDGRLVQVGSTCIADFLGSSEASKLAARACMIAEARALAEDGCEGFGGGSGDRTLAEYLPIVSWCVREVGWMSRTAARDRADGRATADMALTLMSDAKARSEANCEPTAEDCELATTAEAWAEGLTDEQVNAERSDYLHNLRVIGRSGLITYKTAGLAASIVIAYQRAIGRERTRTERAARPSLNEYLGTVGKRETWTAVLDFVTGYETGYGYTTILKFRTADGATIVWKASSTELCRSDVGKTYSVKGTVKKHEEYKGEKQTILSRCVVECLTPAAAPTPTTPVSSPDAPDEDPFAQFDCGANAAV